MSLEPPTADSSTVSRRQFLDRGVRHAAGVAAGVVGAAGVTAWVSQAPAAFTSADRVRVGVIGVRNRGKQLTGWLAAMPDVELVALCDVDESQFEPALHVIREHAPSRSALPRVVTDYRQLLDDSQIDAVVIATPDHAHAPLTVAACAAGKDVYLEAPATHRLEEGPVLMAAAERHRRVVQVGLQQRSGEQLRSAIQAVHEGQIGRVRLARAWIAHRRKSLGHRAECPPPAGVDYNAWLGSAPLRDFHPSRFHFNWRWFWDYGGGELAHWGGHLLDLARWGLQVETPTAVTATGGKFYLDDDQETPDTLNVNYQFGDAMITWEHRLWTMHGVESRSSGVAFYGDQGTLVVDRGGWKIYDGVSAGGNQAADLEPSHLRNFIDCVRSRQRPHADLLDAHLSAALCHYGNAAYRQGTPVYPA